MFLPLGSFSLAINTKRMRWYSPGSFWKETRSYGQGRNLRYSGGEGETTMKKEGHGRCRWSPIPQVDVSRLCVRIRVRAPAPRFPWRFRLSPNDKNLSPHLTRRRACDSRRFWLHFECWLRSSTLILYLEAGVGLSAAWKRHSFEFQILSLTPQTLAEDHIWDVRKNEAARRNLVGIIITDSYTFLDVYDVSRILARNSSWIIYIGIWMKYLRKRYFKKEWIKFRLIFR